MDLHVEQVRDKLEKRAATGLSKYGTDTTRTDYELVDWVNHAQEEAMDLAVYLEVIITRLKKEKESNHHEK